MIAVKMQYVADSGIGYHFAAVEEDAPVPYVLVNYEAMQQPMVGDEIVLTLTTQGRMDALGLEEVR